MRKYIIGRLKLPVWVRRTKLWLDHRIHNMTRRQRIASIVVASVVLLSATIPTALYILKNKSYELSTAVQQLIGTPNKHLAAKITYNSQKHSWQFNQGELPIGNTSQTADMPTANDLKAQIGGSGQRDTSLYAVDMPTDGNKGTTYYDTNTNLSFKLTPKFNIGESRRVDGHLVYPLGQGSQLIYTAKTNGMKEDIVLTKPLGNELTYSYQLDLPDTLEAKILDNGSLGIYSPNPTLFGNIAFGDGQDKEKILSARQTAAKDHLLFVLPAPVVVEAGDKTTKSHTHFTMRDGVLSVVAKDMQTLTYPLSIDPSVVVTSSSEFGSGNGDNISYDTDQISRAKLTGGSFGTWAAANAYNTALSGVGVSATNGYMYIAGGSNGNTQISGTTYAPINSDGTIGTWNSAPSLSIPRTYHGFTTYNGYAYALSGSTTGWSIVGSTEYAPINSNGTLGSWTTTTALPAGRASSNAIAYNGYMYLLGGQDTSSSLNSVAYAPIKADGSLGSWSTTTSFTTARQNANSFAYNGRMYIMGGFNGSSTYYSDTQYATINTDGTLGSWVATTSFTTARAGAFGGVYNGYAYIAGGTATANSTNDAFGDTQYAQINANGTLGTWRSSSTLAAERFSGGSTMYKGRMYIAGGTEFGTGTRSVQYAAINPAGTTASFATAANNFTTARALTCSFAYNGYLYAMGGSTTDSSLNNVTTVQYTAINATTGNVGTWSTTTALPEARGSAGCTAHNGYVYVVGGFITGNIESNTVRYAPINTNGTIGTWVTTAPQLPQAKERSGVFTYTTSSGTYLYVVGGDNINSSYIPKSYYSLIGSNGSLGSWSTASNDLGAGGRIYQGFAQVGKYIYAMGGFTYSPDTAWSTVEHTAIQSNGDLGTWSTTTSMNTATGFTNGTTVNGCIYSLGGENSSSVSIANVQYACPAADGTISTWYNTPNLTVGTTDMGVTSYNGFIYGVGGYTTSSQATTQFAAVNNGGGGATGSWAQKVATIGSTLYGHGFAYSNGYFYLVGGDPSGGGSSATANTYYAPLNSDGTIGTWTATTSLGTARHSHATYISDGYAYVVGGSNSAGSIIGSMEYAPINSNGTLGTWSATTGSLPVAHKQSAAAVYNGYLYSLGGTTGSLSSTVYYTNASSGNISSWSSTTALPYAVRNASAVVNNGYLYVVGGIDGSGNSTKVIYALINSDGTLGSWSYASSLPLGGATSAVAVNGVLYAAGIDGASCNGNTYKATIHAGGLLNPFQQTSTAATCGSANSTALYANGYIYLPVSNGIISGASIDSIERIGRYSKLLNLGGGYGLTNLTYNGLLPNGGRAKLSYRAASSNAVFGSAQVATNLNGAAPSCVDANTMYTQILANLDDTYTSVYPDANGTAANITDFTLSYNSSRAPTNQRLAHGKYFSGEVLQGLDVCGS